MKTKTAVIGGSVVLAILLIIFGVVVARSYHSEPTYSALIISGQEYFDKGDYDGAILEYKAAITMDSTQEDAYLGLAVVYQKMNLTNLAVTALQDGLTHCSSTTQLQAQLSELGEVSSPNSAISNDLLGWNTELLQFISSATYEDYCTKYPDMTVETQDNQCTAEVSSPAISLYFRDTDAQAAIDQAANAPYADAVPVDVVFHSFSDLYQNQTDLTYEQLQNAVEITDLDRIENQITFAISGCRIAVACDADGTIDSAQSATVYPATAEESNDPGALYTVLGSVTDSDGYALQGVSMTFYTGSGTGTLYCTTVTGTSGTYSVGVEQSGAYTVVLSKTGYPTVTEEIYVSGVSSQTYCDFVLAEKLNQEIFIEFKEGVRSHKDSRSDHTNVMYCFGTSGSDSENYMVYSDDSVYLLLAQWELKDSSGRTIGDSEELDWSWNLSVHGSVSTGSPLGVTYNISQKITKNMCSARSFDEGSVYVYNQELRSAGMAAAYSGGSTDVTATQAELQFEYQGKWWTVELSREEMLFHERDGSDMKVCAAFGVATAKQSDQIEIDAVS